MPGGGAVHSINNGLDGGHAGAAIQGHQADQFDGPLMVDNPVWEICERVAEVQALLDDHIAGGKHSAADVVAKAQAVLSEAELLQAIFDASRRIRHRRPNRALTWSP